MWSRWIILLYLSGVFLGGALLAPWLKMNGIVARTAPDATGQWFWGSWRMIDGWLTLGVLGALLALLVFRWRREPPEAGQ